MKTALYTYLLVIFQQHEQWYQRRSILGPFDLQLQLSYRPRNHAPQVHEGKKFLEKKYSEKYYSGGSNSELVPHLNNYSVYLIK